ncbi:MAG TPA: TerC family protein [Bacteroidia bacterium]|nr:TerC family protein [Bacteroidia bacterium]
MIGNTWLWIGFNLFIVLMLTLDLGVFHRKEHVIKLKEALIWTCVWIILALLFNTAILHYYGQKRAIEFLSAYLLEKALSVDNIFVFSMLFSYFAVPAKLQHKALFWGIFGALIMRSTFILSGIQLIQHFHWILYVFGVFLIYTGIRMYFQSNKELKPDENILLKWIKKIFPASDQFHEDHFLVRIDGKLIITRLLMVLIFIEITDLIFAVDSIPAVLAISNDSFIVYTSNVFAILGLRSLYFAISGMNEYFRYLKYGLATILIFVGLKMCAADLIKIPVELSLLIILVILGLSLLFSKLIPVKN